MKPRSTWTAKKEKGAGFGLKCENGTKNQLIAEGMILHQLANKMCLGTEKERNEHFFCKKNKQKCGNIVKVQ